jgi:hypothetical protein
MALTTCNLKVTLGATLTSPLDLSTPDDALNQNKSVVLSNGTGAESGDQTWHDRRTLTTGASETLDLYGTLTNAFGATVQFNMIRILWIINNSTASTLQIGGAAANAFSPMFANSSDILVLRPSGATYPAMVALTAPDATGYDVTSGTADQLKIAHGGENSASLTYDIILIGEQA